MLQSCPHIHTKSIVIIIENANKSNGFGQSMGGTSTSRSKGWGYHEIEQEASSLVDISHRQVYCLELGGSIISKSSKKLKVLLNGFLTEYLPPIDNPRQATRLPGTFIFIFAPHSSKSSHCCHNRQISLHQDIPTGRAGFFLRFAFIFE